MCKLSEAPVQVRGQRGRFLEIREGEASSQALARIPHIALRTEKEIADWEK